MQKHWAYKHSDSSFAAAEAVGLQYAEASVAAVYDIQLSAGSTSFSAAQFVILNPSLVQIY